MYISTFIVIDEQNEEGDKVSESEGGCHSSVVLSAPTILQPQVQIPSTPSMLFSICIIEIVMRKEQK